MPLGEAYKAGKITFSLEGKKLNGMFTLLKTHKNKNWLLLKHDDAAAKVSFDITKEMPESVNSGKCIEDIVNTLN